MVRLITDLSSCFKRNPVALRMEVLCDSDGVNACPDGGVGVYNPGYWGMVRITTRGRKMGRACWLDNWSIRVIVEKIILVRVRVGWVDP